ncbi:MAG TPA: type II toxin-antitoxin system Phd/YefM family antitoxin [Anaerolineae bacterium]|nr:type II toxin-antitoxin system Phd/YefM family antitoxin [Anaerolineae bacterium]
MKTKTVASTEAQNNFGRILNDVVAHHTRYVIKRHDFPQVILLSLADFEQLLDNPGAQLEMATVLRELTPDYELGETVYE